jgi:hypothetical protein
MQLSISRMKLSALVCKVCVCLTLLSGCNASAPGKSTPEIITTTKVVTLPQKKAMPYLQCLIPEDSPEFLEQYPAYTEVLYDTLEQCNARNQLRNDYNMNL